MNRAAAVAIVALSVGGALWIAVRRREADQGARCGPGFVPRGTRWFPVSGSYPPPLVLEGGACDAPDAKVLVAASTVTTGASDWEGTSRPSRAVSVDAFRIDPFEVTRGRWSGERSDAARAASGMTREEAEAYCRTRGGHLPSELQWEAAAQAGAPPARRYPWGDTGAVCRRAAWGLSRGPCARDADGPDTVGAHPDGDSPLGLHDMAGNVAEWVLPAREDDGSRAVARGGSWQTELAADLRTWARLELDPAARDPRVGLRCAYPP